MHEMLAKVPDQKKSIKHLYLNNVRLFAYDKKDKKKQCAEKVVTLKKVLLARIPKQFEEDEARSSRICDGNNGVLVLRDVPM